MLKMKVVSVLLCLALPGVSFLTRAQEWPEDLVITPEKSGFVRTSTHAEVMNFLNTLQRMAPDVHLMSMGKSREGKDIPVAVLAHPRITTPQEAKESGKPVVYIQGNIHGGEVEGKEALMMLMRDILLGDRNYLLDNQIILMAPVYNTDGNDRMEKGRRSSQEDSPPEVGTRENSDGLDLNRDGIKMEALETQALISNVIVPWDPQLFVDLHTTNGTWHAYSLTWAPSYHSAGQASTYEYTNDVMLRSITRTVKDKYGLYFNVYGDYDLREGWPVRNFYTYNHHPRYLVNQFGLRNRMAILSEAFSHERFYQRIFSTYTFVAEILDYTHRHIDEIAAINKKAEHDVIANVIESSGRTELGVRFEMKPERRLEKFRTYEYIRIKKADGSTQMARTGNIVMLDSVTYHARFAPVVTSTLPRGYVIPVAFTAVAELLRKHGIVVAQLDRPRSFEGEIFRVTSYERSARKFEAHFMATARGEFSKATKKFRKGDYVVDLAQPLANLAFYLLEPQSDDGLVSWNFFDDHFAAGDLAREPVAYPVFKYYQSK